MLLVGRSTARNDLTLTLSNENTLAYVLQGREIPDGRVWQQAARFHPK
ncbi:MAG: hypothetical protein WAW42_13335 [Candidatus Competibacteraceae bacterium]